MVILISATEITFLRAYSPVLLRNSQADGFKVVVSGKDLACKIQHSPSSVACQPSLSQVRTLDHSDEGFHG
jgi:hypothetical protein